MQAICDPKDLIRGLTTVARATNQKSNLPALHNVLIETVDGVALKLSATNLETSIVTWVAAQVTQSGAVSAPTGVFSKLLATLPDQSTVTLEVEKVNVQLAANGRKASVQGIPAEDFPILPDIKSQGEPLLVDARALREALACVIKSAATDGLRPVLNAVNLSVDAAGLRLATTDGCRLATTTIPFVEPPSAPFSVNLPLAAAKELGVLLKGEKGAAQVQLRLGKKDGFDFILFRAPADDLTAKLYEGTFPDVTRVIPTQWATRLDIDRKALLDAVKTAMLVAVDNNDIVKIAIDENGSVVIAAKAGEGRIEQAVEAIVEPANGVPFAISFNGHYLEDTLTTLTTRLVRLEFNRHDSLGVFREIDGGDQIHVLAPMELKRSG